MNKKIICLVLVIAMLCSCVATIVVGCGGNNNKDESGDLVVAFLNAGTTPSAIDNVEAAVSAYCQEKLGFGVKFKQVNVYDASSTYTNWLAAGEEIDLLNVFGENCLTYAASKKCREISSLMTEENCPYLLANLDRLKPTMCFDSTGKAYSFGVTASTGYGGYALHIRKDVMQALGLYGEGDGQYVNGQQITYSDLNTIFAAIKASPDYQTNEKGATIYPCSITNSLNLASYMVTCDMLGDASYPMATMMMDPKTGVWTEEIVNYYESAQYKEYVEWIGQCKDKGYIHPDAETTDKSMMDLFKNGQAVCAFLQDTTALRTQWQTGYGYELIQLPVSVPFLAGAVAAQGFLIPSKSSRPNKAMKFINLMYEDVDFINILMYGVEGEQWKFLEGGEEYGLIVDAGNQSGYLIGGWWGDQNHMYREVSTDINLASAIAESEEITAYDKNLRSVQSLDYQSPAIGFVYDLTAQNTRIKNLNSIISRYYTTLNVGAGKKGRDGTFTGEGSTYAELIAALQRAKIGNVIQDKIEQYNAWKANKSK